MPSLREVVYVVLLLVICGVVWGLFKDKVAEPFRTIIFVIVAVALVLFTLRLFGF